MEVPKLVDDPTPIRSITLLSDGTVCWTVGQEDVTAIRVYAEDGGPAPIPWLAVYKRKKIVYRAAAHAFDITYVEADEASAEDLTPALG